MPKFMVHDRWANVLFLHWRVPPNLEPILQTDCSPFILDRSHDGSVWIGLILLTECNVGLPYLRSPPSLTCVTHHGVNVRTYVKSNRNASTVDSNAASYSAAAEKGGIHFSSLECDDRFAAFGANIFGMPYKVASIARRYILKTNINNSINNHQEGALPEFTSANDRDEFACGKSQQPRVKRFHLSSVRSAKESSLFNLLIQSLLYLYDTSLALHGTDVRLIEASSDDVPEEDYTDQKKKHDEKETIIPKTVAVKRSSFSVECEWERCPPEEQVEDPILAQFLLERYYVYTRKYGLNWRGQVEHEPWPVEPAKLTTDLKLTNVASYQPVAMQPLIQHMATATPDSVLFSPGVGPVEFHMLRPV